MKEIRAKIVPYPGVSEKELLPEIINEDVAEVHITVGKHRIRVPAFKSILRWLKEFTPAEYPKVPKPKKVTPKGMKGMEEKPITLISGEAKNWLYAGMNPVMQSIYKYVYDNAPVTLAQIYDYIVNVRRMFKRSKRAYNYVKKCVDRMVRGGFLKQKGIYYEPGEAFEITEHKKIKDVRGENPFRKVVLDYVKDRVRVEREELIRLLVDDWLWLTREEAEAFIDELIERKYLIVEEDGMITLPTVMKR